MAIKRKLSLFNCLVKLATILVIQVLIIKNEFSFINCYSITPQGKILTPISSQDSVELASRSNQQNLLQLAYLDAQEQQLQLQQQQQQQQQQSQTTLSPLLTTISFNNYLDSIQDQQQQQQHSKQSHTNNNINRHYGNQQLDKDFYVDTSNNNQDYKDNNYSYADMSSSRTIITKSNQSESVPSSTAINNHSRNSQQQVPKLSQYLDVSALMLRDRNLTLENGSSVSHQTSHSLSSSSSPSSSSSSSSNHEPGSASITSGSYGLSTPTLNSPSSLTSYLSSGLTAKSHSGLPECATQQVCNAIFVKMNYTQRLCECSSNYNWRCSSEPNEQDGHTIELTRKYDRRIYTQIKTCEPLREIRACKSPSDWTLLALQSERSGKAHYVVVCKCPTYANLEGPYTHNQPPYANIPGIRVYGMLCAQHNARSSAPGYGNNQQLVRSFPEFPWDDAYHVANKTNFSAIHH